jgi:hypothetical protein
MKREVFERRFPVREIDTRELLMDVCYCKAGDADMGLAPGGRMKQEISRDPYRLSDWHTTAPSRCFVHIANSMVWRAITGQQPPTVPPTAEDYTRRGLPWFEYYGEQPAVTGSKTLGGMKSVADLGKEKGELPLPENQTVDPTNVITLRKGLAKNQVREGSF